MSREAVRLFVCAGEASGDRLAASLVRKLVARGPLRALGMAGPALRAAGVEPVARAEEATALGLAEVLGRMPQFARLYRRLAGAARRFEPDAILTVDSPDLLLRLSGSLQGVAPRIHVVSPQLWAWRGGRARWVSRVTDRLLCLLPFEPGMYAGTGLDARFVGHPGAWAHAVPTEPDVIALAPGSRPSEVRRLWPVLREVGAVLRRRSPGVRLVVPAAPTVDRASMTGLDVEFVEGIEGARHASVAIGCSGTATLHWAAAGVPQVAIYRLHPLTWAIGRRLVQVSWVSLPNLVAGEAIIPEILQTLDPERIAEVALDLRGAAGRDQVRALAPVLEELEGESATSRMASAVMESFPRAWPGPPRREETS